ncbi:MAG: acyl-CoA thioesterase [Thermoplasmatota archaeon]
MAYRVPVDVRFADLDALGHVNSGTVLAYAEHARVNWLLESGAAPSASRLPIILASLHVEFKAPIQAAAVEVTMWVSRIGNKSWDFDYEVRDRKTGTLYATVKTVQVAYDYAKGESRPIDAALRLRLESLLNPLAP